MAFRFRFVDGLVLDPVYESEIKWFPKAPDGWVYGTDGFWWFGRNEEHTYELYRKTRWRLICP